MRNKIIIYSIYLFCILSVTAQTDKSKNYVKSIVYTDSTATSSIATISYIDGLGRQVQTVQNQFTPLKKDIVSTIEYDEAEREFRQWLPTPTSNSNGNFETNHAALALAAYGQAEAYTQNMYESSPINKIIAKRGPGSAWNDKPVRTSTALNTANNVIEFGVSTENKLQRIGYYPAQSLLITNTWDEDGKQSCEFKDLLGRLILQRTIGEAGNHDTYYVYNQLGQLSFVLSPEASDQLSSISSSIAPLNNNALGKLGYAYQYDSKGRCITKKLPGCDSISMVYDKADRLVLSQDGNQRKTGTWSYNKYDDFGRIILRGVVQLAETASSLRLQYDNILVKESYIGNNNSIFGYSNNSIPQIAAENVLIANFYDDANRITSLTGAPTILAYSNKDGYGKKYTNQLSDALSAKGLLVGTCVKSLESNHWVYTAMYYDDNGKVVQTRASNRVDGYDCNYTLYNFSGQPLKTLHEHKAFTNPQIDEVFTYEYDHANRLLKTTYSFNNETAIVLNEMQYNEIGQLKTKKIHNGRETINYNYNIRGWQSKINSQNFTEQIFYNDKPLNNPYGYEGHIPCFNGNISATETRFSASDYYPVQYFYAYDKLNRLKKGDCPSWLLNANEEIEQYDKNGNILKLKRDGMAWLIGESVSVNVPVDQLQMTYNGNQKTKTIDYANTQTINEGDWSDIYYTDNDFKDIDDPAHQTEYLYDANGNQTADLNKSIADIKYNLLNLPSKIQFMNGNQTQYIYDAAGTKTAAIYHTAPFPVQLPLGEVSEFDPQQFYSGDIMTSHTFYCGNFVYEGGQLSRVLTPEGYVQVTTNRNMQVVNGQYTLVTTFTPQHNYFLHDHLGNTRVQLTPTASSMAVADTKSYYPFGLQHSPEPWSEFFGYSPTSTNPYLYNGKELDKMHGFDSYDYGARWKGYEDWMGVDPLAEKYYGISPYAYCGGNPVNRIDPDGMDWFQNTHTGEVVYRSDLYKGAEKSMEEGWEWMGESQMFKDDEDDFENDGDRLAMRNGGEMNSYNNKYVVYSLHLKGNKAEKFMDSKGYEKKPLEALVDYTELTPINTGSPFGGSIVHKEIFETVVWKSSTYAPKGSEVKTKSKCLDSITKFNGFQLLLKQNYSYSKSTTDFMPVLQFIVNIYNSWGGSISSQSRYERIYKSFSTYPSNGILQIYKNK